MKCPIALLILVSCVAHAQPATDDRTLALIHANVIDGLADEVLLDTTVLIRGRRIESVGTAAVPAGSEVLDLEGRWLLPGLIDAHAHVFNLAGARRVLEQGTTTVRVLGTSHFVDVRMRELNAAGATDVPRVIAAGYQVRADLVDAFPDFLLDFPQMLTLRGGLHGPDDLRRVVRAMAERRVDFIKVLANERAAPLAPIRSRAHSPTRNWARSSTRRVSMACPLRLMRIPMTLYVPLCLPAAAPWSTSS